jgi:hypothetical protein
MTHSVAVALISHTARNDVSSSLISIAQLCGDSQFTFFTNAHVQQALMKKNMLLLKYCVTFSKKCHLVPSFNNLASSNLELERLVAVQTAKKTGQTNKFHAEIGARIRNDITWSQI